MSLRDAGDEWQPGWLCVLPVSVCHSQCDRLVCVCVCVCLSVCLSTCRPRRGRSRSRSGPPETRRTAPATRPPTHISPYLPASPQISPAPATRPPTRSPPPQSLTTLLWPAARPTAAASDRPPSRCRSLTRLQATPRGGSGTSTGDGPPESAAPAPVRRQRVPSQRHHGRDVVLRNQVRSPGHLHERWNIV